MRKYALLLLINLFAGFTILNAQTVTGIVESSDGPVLGATVLEKGTSNGTATDKNGHYSINVSAAGTLVFSFTGMETQEIAVDGRSQIKVVLVSTSTKLTEVFVTAYGKAKKESFTGAATVVKKDELQKIVTTSVLGALQGTTSGVQVMNTNGQPGSNPQIRVRGITSLTGSSDPLIVVNGAPFDGEFASIDINDVESISVLKDAAATALYGSRASAGVMVITTKKGGSGKPTVEFKATAGVSALALPLHKRVNNAQYYQIRWESLKNGYLDRHVGATEEEAATYATNNLLPSIGNYNAFDKFPLLPDGKFDPTAKPRWTDTWEDILFKPGPRNEYYLSMNGGSPEGLNYFLSMGYLKDKGYLTFSDYDRYNGRLDISNKVNKWLDMGVNLTYSRAMQNTPVPVRQVRFTLDMPDIYPVYWWDDAKNTYALDENGEKIIDMGGGNDYSYDRLSRRTWGNQNPLEEARDDINRNEIQDVGARAYISITPVKGLNLRSQLSADQSSWNHTEYWSSKYGWAAAQGGVTSRQNNRNFSYTFTNLATYERTFGDHSINLLAGMEAYANKFNLVSSAANGLPVPTIVEIDAASLVNGGGSFEDNHRLSSYLSRAEYNYKQKYYLSGSFRRDGTSRFSPESRWGNFGSAGVSWIASKESFMDKFSGWLNDLTVRASYGTLGNERISNLYAYRGLYNLSADLGTTAFQLSTLTNDLLKWETTKQTNIGLTAAIFNRLTVDVDYYIKKTDDMLFNRELPLSSGVGSVAENVGDLQNKGIDVHLHSVNIQSPNNGFRWESTLNFSHYKNEIISLPDKEINNGLYRWTAGVSAFDYYLREWAGINPSNGRPLWRKETFQEDDKGNPVLGSDGKLIVIKSETTENINEATYNYRGNALPDLFGNIMNTFRYKGVDLSINLYFSIGGLLYDNRYLRMSHSGSRNVAETFTADAIDYWTPENTDAKYPRLTDYAPEGNTYISASTRYLVNASYARIRNITVGYTLPLRMISRLGLSNVRVFAQADNYVTFFGMRSRGLDPEQAVSGSVSADVMPVSKTIIGGISIRL